MSFLTDWWNDRLRKIEPEVAFSDLAQTFNSAPGQRTLRNWLNKINMNPPDTIDPYEIVHWKAQCKFVSDIVLVLDAANNPDKYRIEQPKKPNVIGGHFGSSY